MDYREQKRDPRWVAAGMLFDTTMATRNLGNGHARDNLKYAVQISALTPEEAGYSPEKHAALLADTVRFWIKEKFRPAYLAELEGIVRSAAASHPAGNTMKEDAGG